MNARVVGESDLLYFPEIPQFDGVEKAKIPFLSSNDEIVDKTSFKISKCSITYHIVIALKLENSVGKFSTGNFEQIALKFNLFFT